MTTKTTINADSTGNVTISYIDIFGERVTREFTCPVAGGYVREGDRQVCERLSNMGNTLRCGQRSDLINLIRREYRAMRAAEKREAARYN
jgi:hypothetical protein